MAIIDNDTVFDWLERNVNRYPEMTGSFARGTRGVDEQTLLLQLMTRIDMLEAKLAEKLRG